MPPNWHQWPAWVCPKRSHRRPRRRRQRLPRWKRRYFHPALRPRRSPRLSPGGRWPSSPRTDTMRHLSLRDIDWPLLLITLVICGVGVLQIYSATMDTDYHGAWWRQILFVVGGLFLMWLIMAVDYHSLMNYVPMLFVGSVVAL